MIRLRLGLGLKLGIWLDLGSALGLVTQVKLR